MMGVREKQGIKNTRSSGSSTWRDHFVPEMGQVWLFFIYNCLYQEKTQVVMLGNGQILCIHLGSNRGRLIFLCCVDVILWKCFHSI